MKIVDKLKVNFLKLRFLKNKNIILSRKIDIPLSSNIQINKKACCNIGESKLNTNVSIRIRENAGLKIGQGVIFNSGCILTCRKNIQIGNNVIFGPNVMIFDHDHDYKSMNFKENYICGDIIIEDNCWIGANCIILKGTHIRKNSVIAAGSIVNGEVNENVIYYNKIEKKERVILERKN